MTDPRHAGPILDALGVTFDLDIHDQVTEVLVLGKTSNFESGDTGFLLANSPGMDFITQHGLPAVARRVLEDGEISEVD